MDMYNNTLSYLKLKGKTCNSNLLAFKHVQASLFRLLGCGFVKYRMDGQFFCIAIQKKSVGLLLFYGRVLKFNVVQAEGGQTDSRAALGSKI